MTEWRALQMREVMLGFFDGPHATPAPAESGPVFLGIKNITDAGALDLSEIRHIAEDDFAQWTRRVTPEPGDVVFTYEATLHRYALIPEGFRGCLGRRLALIRPDRSVVLPRFLHFLMLGPVWRATVTERVISGATVDRIPIIDFGEFPVAVPDLVSQQAVVDVLGAIDDLIENNQRQVEVLEEMARAIYREWFVHLRYPGHEDAAFVHSPLGRIPEGWAVRPFAEIGSFVNGFAFKPAQWSDDGRPIIKIKQLKQGIATDTPRCDEAEVDKKFWVEQGDLLFSWSADLGVYRWAEEPGLLNQHLFTVRPSGDLTLTFLFHALDESMPQFWNRAQGTTMRHIKRAALSEVATVAPPTDLLDRFTATVEPMTQEVIALKQSSSHLASIRDLLLPILVTGQIDVSSLDVDVLVEGAVL